MAASVRNQKLLASFLGAATDDESTASVEENETLKHIDLWAVENYPCMESEHDALSDQPPAGKSDPAVRHGKDHLGTRSTHPDSQETVEDHVQRIEPPPTSAVGKGVESIPPAIVARLQTIRTHTTDDSLQWKETNVARDISRTPSNPGKQASCCTIL
jgi:hypothetical protein